MNNFKDEKIISSGLLKSRMWSQYGENHQGACLILSRSKLLKSLDKNDSDKNLIIKSNINYKNPYEHRLLLNITPSDLQNKTPKEVAMDFYLLHKDKLVFSKQNDYRDENEFRIIMVIDETQSQTNADQFIPIQESLIGVVFGDQFPQVYIPSVNALLQNSEICARKLKWNKTSFYLLEL